MDRYTSPTPRTTVVRITPDGKAVNFAGTGSGGYTGDDGPAVDAELDYPDGVTVDAGGVVYIADSGSGVIRRVDAGGTITTLSSGLKHPTALLVDTNGLVIAADTGNDRIVAIERDGTLHVIAGAAKNGVADDSDDARLAELDGPCALALGTDGTIYFADCGSGRLRKLVPH